MIQKSTKKKEESSYQSPLTMTSEEYLEYVKKEMEENSKLTDQELMDKYKV